MTTLVAITCVWLSASSVALPPLNFDKPYRGVLTVINADANQIHAYCGGLVFARSRIMACAVPRGEQCTIVLPSVESGLVTQAQQDRLRRHEIGHCNGWLADHAGSIFTRTSR